MDIIDDFLTRFAAGAGTLFVWHLERDGQIRAKIGDDADLVMCPLTAQYAMEYGPCWGEHAVRAAAVALKIPTTPRDWIIAAADNHHMEYLEIARIRDRLLRITRGLH